MIKPCKISSFRKNDLSLPLIYGLFLLANLFQNEILVSENTVYIFLKKNPSSILYGILVANSPSTTILMGSPTVHILYRILRCSYIATTLAINR